MSKTIVVYKSGTGYTKKYADWIAKELNCDCIENRKLTGSQLEPYDTIILGGSVMAGMIVGADLIKKNYPQLKQKKLLVYACGMDEPEPSVLDQMWHQNFTEEQLSTIQCFYCRGGLNLDKLKGIKKLMLKMMCKKCASKPEKEQKDLDMIAALEKPMDFTDIAKIQPIVAAARS